MARQKDLYWAFGFVIGTVVNLVLWGGVGYVICHFIEKFW